MKKALVYILFIFCSCATLFAQETAENNDLVENELENHFYEAVKQRAIENYDKAIIELELAVAKDKDNAALHFELGKNYLDIKKFPQAETAFQKAVALDASQRWYWNGLYDVYYLTKDYEKSIGVLKKLVVFDANMKEDLVSVYFLTKQNDLALSLINEIETSGVLTKKMEFYKLQILDLQPKTERSVAELENEIKKFPKIEQNYIDLIIAYANTKQEDKAFETAQKLALTLPQSEWAQISMFKVYLDKNDGANASQSLLSVLNNKNVALPIKHRLFNEFLILTSNNPNYFGYLDQAIAVLEPQSTVPIMIEVGKFFFSKNPSKALFYFEKSLAKNPNDVEVALLAIQLYLQQNNFEKSAEVAQEYTELYPTLATFYFYAAVSQSNLNNFKKAIDWAEAGLDFLVDNTALERQFYLQLSNDYKTIGNAKKSAIYADKAQKLK